MINFEENNSDILKGYSMLLYFAGSFILNEPSEECIRDLVAEDIFKKMPVSSNNPNYVLASSFLNQLNSNNKIAYDAILADHLNLFGGSGESMAPPYESYYRSREHLLNQQQAMEVRNIYRSYGWKSSAEGNIPDDHLGIEIQFLNLMLEKYIAIEDNACHRELQKDIKKFIDNHIKPWIRDWNADIQQKAISDFYRGVGYLVVACTQDVYYLV
jgi:TorA maturation chaperone TorD